MGSPLSPIAVNLYMETFERKAIISAIASSRLWLPSSCHMVQTSWKSFIIQHPQTQFTREMEADDQISFLDVSVRKNAGTFITAVYRKSTHTDLYIHYSSHHHPKCKIIASSSKVLPHSVFILNEYECEAKNKLTAKQCVVECFPLCRSLLCHSGLHQPGRLQLGACRAGVQMYTMSNNM